MPRLRNYQLFISHAWHRSEHYQTVTRWLNEAPNLFWTNLSVPEHNPVRDGDVEYALRNQMRYADAFIILGGMYVAHSDWIDFELRFARRIGRPIIGVRPWGSMLMPTAIQKAATTVVGWQRASVVNAVRWYGLRSA